MISNQLKMQVKSGNTLIGAWLSVPCVSVAEAMASCGFDWMAFLRRGAESLWGEIGASAEWRGANWGAGSKHGSTS